MTRAPTVRAIVIGVSVALAALLSGCLSEETQEVNLGYGVVVEVPADLEGKELALESVGIAYSEELDFTEEIERCVLARLEEAPAREFDQILKRRGSDQKLAGLDLTNRYTSACIKSGDNVVETDANPLTLRVLREGTVSLITAVLESSEGGPPLSGTQVSCIVDQYRRLSDSELIELVNSTFRQQEQFGYQAGGRCA